MPPTRNPDMECFDDPLDDSGSEPNRESLDLDRDITVLVNPRLAEGYFVAYRDGELLSWGRMGVSTYPQDADTVHLHPADYARLKTLQKHFDEEESAHAETE
jgi:hypothetical protein